MAKGRKARKRPTRRPPATHVFVVQHEREQPGGHDDVKFIGVYRTRKAAMAAIARLRRVAGFVDHPDGFAIDKYRVNETHWRDGFISAEEALAAIKDC